MYIRDEFFDLNDSLIKQNGRDNFDILLVQYVVSYSNYCDGF